MGLAVAMVLFLVGIAIVLAALTALAWGLAQTIRLGVVAARVMLRRGRT